MNKKTLQIIAFSAIIMAIGTGTLYSKSPNEHTSKSLSATKPKGGLNKSSSKIKGAINISDSTVYIEEISIKGGNRGERKDRKEDHTPPQKHTPHH